EADAVDMAAPRPAACSDEDLVAVFVRCDLLDDRRQSLDAPVAYGLAAYLEYVDLGKQPGLRRQFHSLEQILADETLTHELALHMESLSILLAYQCHGFSFVCRVSFGLF